MFSYTANKSFEASLAKARHPLAAKRLRSIRRLASYVSDPKKSYPADKIDIVLRIFLDSLVDDDEQIRSVSIAGLGSLAETKRIPTSKIDVVVELVITRCRHKNDTIRESAVATLGSLAKANLLPSYSQSQIILLLIQLLSDSSVGIRQIALIAIGSLVNNESLPAAHVNKILEICVGKCRENDESFWKPSLQIFLGLTIRCDNLQPQSILQIIVAVINKSTHSNLEIRSLAVQVIKNVTMCEQIPQERANLIGDIMVNRLKDSNIDIRSNAMVILSKLAEFDMIAADLRQKALDVMILEANRQDGARASALECISRLAENNCIHSNRIHDLVQFLIKKCEDNNAEVRASAITSLSQLSRNSAIPIAMNPSLIEIAIGQLKQPSDTIKSNSLLLISRVLNNKGIPNVQCAEILELMIHHCNYNNENVRNYSVGSIFKMAELGMIASWQVLPVLEHMMICSNDEYPKIRYYAIGAISKLAQRNLIPESHIDIAIEALIIKCEDPYEDARAVSLLTISFFVLHNAVPSSVDPDTILDTLLKFCDDSHESSRSVALSTISKLIDDKKIPEERINTFVDTIIRMADDKYPAAKNNALWALGNFARHNMIPRAFHSFIIEVVWYKVKYDDDIGTRLCACMLISHYCHFVKCEENLINACVHILLALSDEPIWKFRAIEGLCGFVEAGEFGGLVEPVMAAICLAHDQGEDYFPKAMKPSGKKKVADSIDIAMARLSVYRLSEPVRRRRLSDAPLRTIISESVGTRVTNQIEGAFDVMSTIIQSTISGNQQNSTPIKAPTFESIFSSSPAFDPASKLQIALSASIDVDTGTRQSGYEQLREVADDKTLSKGNVVLLLEKFLEGGKDSGSDKIRSASLHGINILFKNKLISLSEKPEIVDLLLQGVDDQNVLVSIVALTAICDICSQNALPPNFVNSVANIFLRKSEHYSEKTRALSVSGLTSLAKLSLIPLANILKVLDVLSKACGDSSISVRCDAISAIGHLARQGAIPTSRVYLITDLIRTKSKDANADVKKNALIALANISKENDQEEQEFDITAFSLYDGYTEPTL